MMGFNNMLKYITIHHFEIQVWYFIEHANSMTCKYDFQEYLMLFDQVN